jgi:P27 family predicted phage terminase small subunit
MNEQAQELFDYLALKYKLNTDRDLSLLEMYCGAFINMRAAQKCIDELGVVVMDRYGSPKQNPANDVLIKNKLQAMRALEKLGLDEIAEDGVLKDFE